MVETILGIILLVLCVGMWFSVFVYGSFGKRDFPDWMIKPLRKKKHFKTNKKGD